MPNSIISPLVYRAAALATGCQLSIEYAWGSVFDLRQNKALGTPQKGFIKSKDLKLYPGGEVANVVLNKYGAIDYEWGIKSASTDFVRHLLYLIIYTYFCLTIGERYLWCVILVTMTRTVSIDVISSSFSSSRIW